MANWKYKLKIKDLLTTETSKEAVKVTAGKVSKRIESFMKWHPEDDFGWELDDIIDRFAGFVEDGDVEEFNHILDELYDWTDRELVWIE